MEKDKPTIGITMGDPCGVGAEIIVRSLANPDIRGRAKFVIFGFSDQLEYTASRLELPLVFFRNRWTRVVAFEVAAGGRIQIRFDTSRALGCRSVWIRL